MNKKSYQVFLYFLIVGTVVGFFVVSTYAATVYTRTSLAGTYKCWSFNANGRGGKCTNPPLTLNKNGSYTMSSERGTYTIKGNTIALSKSKTRGAGKILEAGLQIQFSYTYKGSVHTMTFLRQTPAAASVVLELTIKYPSEDAMGWVNTVQLIPEGKKEPTYDALAYNDTKDKKMLKAYWKKGVPGGQVYDVYTGTGTWDELVGKVDLKNVKGTAKRTVVVTKKEVLPEPSSPSTTETVVLPPPAQVNLPACNPSIPKYAQPACRD